MIAAYILVIFLFFYVKLEAQVWAKAGQGPHQGKQQQMLNNKKNISGHSRLWVCGDKVTEKADRGLAKPEFGHQPRAPAASASN